MPHNSIRSQRGVAVLYIMVALTILLGIGVGLSVLIVGELQTLRAAGDSVFALGAAETGIERGLYEDRKRCSDIEEDALDAILGCVKSHVDGIEEEDRVLANNAEYELQVLAGASTSFPDDECESSHYCIQSRGEFDQAFRKIQASR